MAVIRCTQCSATVPGEARFCPRCGRAMADGASRFADRPAVESRAQSAGRVPGALPSRSRMPVAGMLFLAAAVLGPTMIAVGVSSGSALLVVAGIAVAILLIVLLLLGMVF